MVLTLFYIIGFRAAFERGMWRYLAILIFVSTTYDEKFRLLINVALSTNIRVMTRICVEITALAHCLWLSEGTWWSAYEPLQASAPTLVSQR